MCAIAVGTLFRRLAAIPRVGSDTGPGGVYHYIEDCPHTQDQWHNSVATAQARSWGNLVCCMVGSTVYAQQAVDQYVL